MPIQPNVSMSNAHTPNWATSNVILLAENIEWETYLLDQWRYHRKDISTHHLRPIDVDMKGML